MEHFFISRDEADTGSVVGLSESPIDQFDIDLPTSGTIKFAEKEPLPGSKNEATILNQNGFGSPK